MKRFLTRSLALALCLALSCSAVPGARAASDDPPSLASASAEDIYATPPNTNRDGLLRFSDEATVSFGTSGSSSKMTVADALNQACRSLSRSVRGTACSLDYISYVAISPNQGTLYNGYIAEGDPGAGVAGVLNYYYNNPEMSYKIEDLQFVPKISFSGNAVVTYYGYYNYYDSVMDANRVGSYAGRLYITVGKIGWKHRLTHTGGNKYRFVSDGHAYPVIFRIGSDGKAKEFEINWGNGEKLGPWTKAQ